MYMLRLWLVGESVKGLHRGSCSACNPGYREVGNPLCVQMSCRFWWLGLIMRLSPRGQHFNGEPVASSRPSYWHVCRQSLQSHSVLFYKHFWHSQATRDQSVNIVTFVLTCKWSLVWVSYIVDFVGKIVDLWFQIVEAFWVEMHHTNRLSH